MPITINPNIESAKPQILLVTPPDNNKCIFGLIMNNILFVLLVIVNKCAHMRKPQKYRNYLYFGSSVAFNFPICWGGLPIALYTIVY